MNGMRHLFLTGEIRTGKSTLIRRVLSLHSQWRLGGFVTVTEDYPSALGAVYILPAADMNAPRTAQNRAGVRWAAGRYEPFAETFDAEGVRILRESAGCDVLLMDELGVMERRAKEFHAAVLEALDGPVPVLGVIKPKDAPLLNAIRERKDVCVLEVTQQNRDALLQEADAFVTAAVTAADR